MASDETQAQYDQLNAFLSDISIKFQDLEEKNNLLKDRVLLIGENLVSEKEELAQEIAKIKDKITLFEEELRKIKMALQRIIEDSNNLVRRNEFEILVRQFEMFQPLNLARISDVEDIVRKNIKNLNK